MACLRGNLLLATVIFSAFLFISGISEETSPCFTGTGNLTCLNITECVGYPCTSVDVSECATANGTYTCTCSVGFERNGTSCAGFFECISSGFDGCGKHASCANNSGNYSCTYETGSSGDGSTDINECDPNNNCTVNATCTNTNGSFYCICSTGFTGDGIICTDIDECTDGNNTCHQYANCTNTMGSHNCTCKEGFSGNGSYCQDIDECTDGNDTCDENADCTNTIGSHNCTCKEGFSGNGSYCQDINECDEMSACHKDANCSNTIGSHNCTCKEGYNGNGTYCEDIDECNSTPGCASQATCFNQPGSYECICNNGYYGNGTYCTDIMTIAVEKRSLIVLNSTTNVNWNVSLTIASDANNVTVNVTLNVYDFGGGILKNNNVVASNIITSNMIPFNLPGPISPDEAGIYVFVASARMLEENSTIFMRRANVSLVVHVNATVSINLKNITLERTRLDLTVINCTVYGIPLPSVNWLRNQNMLSNASTPVFVSQPIVSNGYKNVLLFVGNITSKDSGSYVCQATNQVGEHNSNVSANENVQIYVPPILNKSASSPEILLQFATRLQCTYEGLPASSIMWNVGNLSVNETSFENSTIYIETSKQENNEYTSTSFLNLPTALCFGRNFEVSCSAKSTVGISTAHLIRINPEYYREYNGIYYIFKTTEMNYSAANWSCNSLGGTLARMNNARTYRFLRDVIHNGSSSGIWINDAKFYIGVRYQSSVWTWANGDRLNEQELKWIMSTLENTNGQCVLLSLSGEMLTAISDSCSTSNGFICEITGFGQVRDVKVFTAPCNGSVMNASWSLQQDFNFKRIFHHTTISPSFSSQREEIKFENSVNPDILNVISTTHLLSDSNYILKIEHFYDTCIIPITYEDEFRSGVGVPPTLGAVSTSKRYIEDTEKCYITWKLPDAYPPSNIILFRIVAMTTIEKMTTISRDFTDVIKIYDISAKNNLTDENITSYSIPLQANSRYRLRIQAESCAGYSPFLNATEDCVSSPRAPPVAPEPVLVSLTGSQPSMTISAANETNGPISCYLLVGHKQRNINSTLDLQSINGQFISNISISEKTVISEGQSYLAIAFSRFENTINITIGNGSYSSCSPSNTSLNRKKRNVMNSFEAYNAHLKAGSNYSFYIITVTRTNSTYLDFRASMPAMVFVPVIVTPVPPESGDNSALWSLLVLLLIPLVAFLLYKKYKRNKQKHESPIQAVPLHPIRRIQIEQQPEGEKSYPIPVEKLESIFDENHTNGYAQFNEQFDEVKENSKLITRKLAQAPDKAMNRYQNIIPFQATRVPLQTIDGDPSSSYINASYITDPYDKNTRFIASQGPLPVTSKDFWRMVWEKGVRVIVTLANPIEGVKVKCDKYWPDNQKTIAYEKLTVMTKGEIDYGYFILRRISIDQKTEEETKSRTVNQYHYTTWPDHGVPETTSGILHLHESALASQGGVGKGKPPIIVHCSAGVGRTGTFIGTNFLLSQLKKQTSVDIFETVTHMRKQRVHMVQTALQYIFLHKLIAESYVFGRTAINKNAFAEYCTELEREHKFAQITGFQQQFENLEKFPPPEMTQETGNFERNRDKNWDSTVIPYDHNRVILTMEANDEVPPYINASSIQGCRAADSFLVAQDPINSTVEYFCRMIMEYKTVNVIMLSCDKDKSTERIQYWWSKLNEVVNFGNINVTLTSEQKFEDHIERDLLFVRDKEELNVTQVQWIDWDDILKKPQSLTNVVKDLQKKRYQQKDKSPILVHCVDGSGRCGVFCTLYNLIRKLRNENNVDVFRTVKDLRDQRRCMVKTEEEYEFCYYAIMCYLSEK